MSLNPNPEYWSRLSVVLTFLNPRPVLDMGESFLRVDPEQIKTITTKSPPLRIHPIALARVRAIRDKSHAGNGQRRFLSKRLWQRLHSRSN